MAKIITYADVVEDAVGEFTADASELGLPPGQWPRTLPTNMGNGLPFVIRKFAPGGTVYEQSLGCLTLRVFND